MFRKLINQFKCSNEPDVSIDPSAFNDPLAEKTQWTPLSSMSNANCTHKVNINNEEKFVLKPLLVCGIFYKFIFWITVATISITLYRIATDSTEIISNSLKDKSSGLIFSIVSLIFCKTMLSNKKAVIFDKKQGYFWKGNSLFCKLTKLEEIQAIQLISKISNAYLHTDVSLYYSYELNTILKDGKRINILDHNIFYIIKQDAQKLADFLGKPLWDATLNDKN